jgi:ubiquinone/menaquinone biosynthesis C-methylase UbiE
MLPDLAPLAAAYDTLADAYAERFGDELSKKPFDRALLDVFAELVGGEGKVADLGCGPGMVTDHLSQLGLDVEGVDASPGMIRVARERMACSTFHVARFEELPFADGALSGATAFYAIVHLRVEELGAAFREMARCLAPGAPLLLSFHVASGVGKTEVNHIDELLGHAVSMDFCFLPTAAVRAALEASGFAIDAVLERQGHAAVEHPSLRCYVLALRE